MKKWTPRIVPDQDLLMGSDVAKWLHIHVNTLYVLRQTNRCPFPWLKIGARVLYRRCDIEKFLELSMGKQGIVPHRFGTGEWTEKPKGRERKWHIQDE